MTLSLASDFSSKMSHLAVSSFLEAVSRRRRPAFITNTVRCFVPYHKVSFGAGAHMILGEPNAGGSSEKSEALSIEFFERVWGAKLEYTEMGISYKYDVSKKTDYAMRLYSSLFGVSVTRAMNFSDQFSFDDALNLLTKKLRGVRLSTRDTLVKWKKQILHIFVARAENLPLLEAAFTQLCQTQKRLVSNTIVMVTHATDAPWVFTNLSSMNKQSSVAPLWERFFAPKRRIFRERSKEPQPQPCVTPPSIVQENKKTVFVDLPVLTPVLPINPTLATAKKLIAGPENLSPNVPTAAKGRISRLTADFFDLPPFASQQAAVSKPFTSQQSRTKLTDLADSADRLDRKHMKHCANPSMHRSEHLHCNSMHCSEQHDFLSEHRDGRKHFVFLLDPLPCRLRILGFLPFHNCFYFHSYFLFSWPQCVYV
jgi:hypothetical protein